jgi:monovalent cation/proton antiporter MnhG/PhaG subunit
MRDVAEYVLLALGVGILALSAVGVLAMRQVYDRLHYVGSAGVGSALVCVAVTVRESFSLIGNKALLIAAFMLLSGPVLVHVTARAARLREGGEWSLRDGEEVEVEEP